ncbi:MAG: 16S rRNA (cytosine(967)-C(5))-methyltransferase RsmB [Gammaproteobacteria bacterium]|jgi:16S rRNA (cytosine967-C5)-methyltransferase|nr:16S rRNA (cytosine(967)-C(5))-methyltransferase RsmB [Gammaproteobacteria bacterium]
MSRDRQGARLRAAAAQVVDAVVTSGRSLDAALPDSESRVAKEDRALLRLLCYGTLRRHWRLQSWIDQLLNRPLRGRDSVVNALLAVGLYQLTDTRIPDHAVVSQTVEATRLLRRPKLAGLLNAVLRRFLREDIASAPPGTAEATYDHPQWLIDAIENDWPNESDAILAANNARAPMWLRVDASRMQPSEYVRRLQESGIEAASFELIDGAVKLAEPVSVEELPGFSEGLVSVQDAAAQLAAPWLLNEPGRRRVLDACAAPGGKSGHLLELGGPDIDLTCLDSDADRLRAVEDNLARLGRSATLVCADASTPQAWWDGETFDAILLDAPCSATGVIRRHPDIKLLRRASDIESLAGIQRALLEALWPLLAPGGRLLYVTCSVLAAENDEVVARFVEATPDASEEDALQNNNIRDVMQRKTFGFQVLPGAADMDGFFYACLVKAG